MLKGILTFSKILLSTIPAFALVACGTSTSKAPDLNVDMQAVFSPPSTATGNTTPILQEYSLEAINLTDAAGTVTNLVTEAKSYKIINRPQIIFSSSLADQKGTSFVKIGVRFGTALKTTTKTSQEIASTLATPLQELSNGFVIEETSSVRLIIKAKWGNSVTRDEATGAETVADPIFELKVE